MRYLLTGGGTGGHVYPALAVAEHLRLVDSKSVFLYVGVKGRAEEHVVPPTGIPLRCIRAAPMPTTRAPGSLARFFLVESLGVLQAFGLLRRWRPDVIVGTGGYVSAPVLAANSLRARVGASCPVLLHEQNAVPGRLNRVASAWATVVACAFPSAAALFPSGRALVCGYPVRRAILSPPSPRDARASLGIPADRIVVLVFGGSLGSRSLNRGIVAALPRLCAHGRILVVHATGRARRAGYDPVADTDRALASLPTPPDGACYRRIDYLDPIAPYLAAADLVVSRAGAGTLNELCALGRAAILVPKANLPGDHQVRNALALQGAGAAEIVYESPKRTPEGVVDSLDPDELAERIVSLVDDPDRRERLASQASRLATPEAAGHLARLAFSLAKHEPVGDLPPPTQWPTDTETERLALMSPRELLDEVVARARTGGLPPRTRAYVAYRADGYLSSGGWEQRNWGVKLAGALRAEARVGLLASFVTDRHPGAPRWRRTLGLDYVENGFIRRNAVVALTQIGVWDEAVHGALREALEDPYFEVRAAALGLAKALAPHVAADAHLCAAITSLTKDPRFEVRAAALEALGEVADASAIPCLTAHFLDPNWKVRAAAVRALTRLVARGVVPPPDRARIREYVAHLLPTSTGFTPLFDLKQALVGLTTQLEANGHVEAPL